MTSLASVRRRVADLLEPEGPPLVGAERVMHWLGIGACVFFAATAFWESFGAPRSGHFGTSSGYALAGENMVNWKKFAVVPAYWARPATPDQYYCHHPYGITVLEAIAYVLFGHHWFTTRAGAIFCSVISPPALYAFGRRAWGVIPASAATLFFVFTPIALAFNTFSNLEEPTIAGGLVFGWATARIWETSKVRYLFWSAFGALLAVNGDWSGFVFLFPVLAFGFFRAYVFPRRWYGRLDDRMYARWFAVATTVAVCTFALYLALYVKADKLGDILGSYHQRSSGSEMPIDETLNQQRRKLWLGTMLTPIVFGALGAGIPLALVRLVKKPLEIFPIAWFLAASFQYFFFKQGADIHIFWPHYYAPAAALAAGTFVATVLGAREAVVGLVLGVWEHPTFTRLFRNGTAVVVGCTILMPIALLARMGIPQLVQGRKTGGRFDQNGALLLTDADLTEFTKWAYANVPIAGTTIQVVDRFEFLFAAAYAGERPYVHVPSVTPAKPEDSQRIAIVETRNQPIKELERIARDFSVEAVGPFWRVDRAEKGPTLVALKYEEREPTMFEWMFISGTDVVRKISREEDPWKTWELRDALNLPTTAPTVAPVTVDELRIAHNLAVHDGDRARADELAAKTSRMVGRPANLGFTDGLRLQGIDVHHGPAIVVTLFWETDGSFKKVDTTFHLKCKLLAPPPLWVGSIDYFEKEMAPVPIIHVGSWKPGYLYTQRFVALHRIGKEECRGSFENEFRPVTGDPNPVFITFD
jgi:hypothetical protein